MSKAVVLLSGGLDSTVCLYWARQNYASVMAIGFDYMQRHYRELGAAAEIANAAGVPFEVLRCVEPFALAKSSINSLHIDVTDAASTVLPGRNLIFLSMAAIYAKKHGADSIVFGATATDYTDYSDCRPHFFAALQNTLREGGVEVEIVTPLIDMCKADAIRLGRAHGAPLEFSRSCYMDGAAPCEKCPACSQRSKAFAEVAQ